MALSAKVGAFNTGIDVVTSTIVISDVGFQPKVIIFWWAGRTDSTDAVGRRNSQYGMGVAISATERWANSAMEIDNSVAEEGARGKTVEACISVVTEAAATAAFEGLLDLQTMDSGGFTLVVDDVMPYDMRVHYIALGGSDLTNYKAGDFLEPNATGNYTVTDPGFRSDFILFVTDGNNLDTTMPCMEEDGNQLGIGFAISSSQQGVVVGNSDEGSATMDTDSYCRSDECIIRLPYVGGNPTDRNTFVQMEDTGFTINKTLTGFSVRNMYLALKGGSYIIGNLLTQTDTITDIVESGFGFQPKGGMFLSHCLAESTAGTAQVNNQLSIGAFDSITSRGTQSIISVDNVADSIVSTAVEHDAVYVNISVDASPVVEGLMDIKSIDSDGFTCIMDDADPSQSFVIYFVVGDTLVGGDPEGSLIGGKLIRGGLLRHGVLIGG